MTANTSGSAKYGRISPSARTLRKAEEVEKLDLPGVVAARRASGVFTRP